MTDDSANILWAVGALVLAISALLAHRPSVSAVARALLGWAAIAAIAWALVANREAIGTLVSGLGDRLGIGDQTVVGETVRIATAPDGHFWARAEINGRPKRLLIDSGATITALSAETARAVGIDVGSGGFPALITTANGTVSAQRATAERIKVGGLEMRDVGVVVSPAFAGVDVLGMNFLSRLGSWRVEGRTLILEPNRVRSDPELT